MLKHKITILILLLSFGVIMHFVFIKSIEANARSEARLQLEFAKECIAKDPLVNSPETFSWGKLSNRLDTCVSNLKISDNSGIVVLSLHDMKVFWDMTIHYNHNKEHRCIDGPINDESSYSKCDKYIYMIYHGYDGSSTATDKHGDEYWIDWTILPTSGMTFDQVSRHDALKDNNIDDLNQIALIYGIDSKDFLSSFNIVHYFAGFTLILYLVYSVLIIYSNECFSRRVGDKT